jgi:hypothetical protein
MRRLALAGDVPPLEAHTVAGGLAGLATATVGGFGLWLANRLLGKAAVQSSLNASFKDFTDQLQEERKEMVAERTAERLAWAAERAQLRGEIINLTQAVESLKAHLRRAGLAIPEDHSPPTGQMLILKGDDQA